MSEIGASVPRKSVYPHGASLAELVREVEGAVVLGDPAARVIDVRHDSREVVPGDLFVARQGRAVDGASFARDAVERGAVAVAASVDLGAGLGVPVVRVPDAERALAFFSDAVWGHPSWSMDVAGVTGTNGKTTTAWLLERVLTACGATAGLIGTVAHRFGELEWPALHTTPEADDIARRLAAMRDHGAASVVMEVSSHALTLSRVEAVRYRAAGFTNLTQDHLDFHGTLAAYVAAKRRLFTELSPAVAVLNVDDPVGAEFARLSTSPVTLSARGAKATLRVTAGGASADGVDATVETPEGPVALRSPLRGAHNVENLLLVLGMAWAMGVPYDRAAEAIAGVDGAPGRLERVAAAEGEAGFDVLVDYAHTPDALSRVLATLRLTTRGRIVCVFGCGGDRDRGKRPLMGAAVGRGADLAILTSDNPRSEDPARIVADAEAGLRGEGADYEVIVDRRAAIARAVELARPGDVVLIAGKGHETYQEVHGRRSPFDDRVEARAALAARVRRGG